MFLRSRTILGSLNNDDGNENVSRKSNFALLLLLCDYSNSFDLYSVGVVSRSWIVQVRKEKEKFTVVCSCSPQNLKFGHFTLLFCRGRQRNVQKHITHVQSDCFLLINLIVSVLWRSCCRRRCLSSLLFTAYSVLLYVLSPIHHTEKDGDWYLYP